MFAFEVTIFRTTSFFSLVCWGDVRCTMARDRAKGVAIGSCNKPSLIPL